MIRKLDAAQILRLGVTGSERHIHKLGCVAASVNQQLKTGANAPLPLYLLPTGTSGFYKRT
jgi:hypothetical protein